MSLDHSQSLLRSFSRFVSRSISKRYPAIGATFNPNLLTVFWRKNACAAGSRALAAVESDDAFAWYSPYRRLPFPSSVLSYAFRFALTANVGCGGRQSTESRGRWKVVEGRNLRNDESRYIRRAIHFSSSANAAEADIYATSFRERLPAREAGRASLDPPSTSSRPLGCSLAPQYTSSVASEDVQHEKSRMRKGRRIVPIVPFSGCLRAEE
ncbi:hypothetical protein R3P38DRAFT_2758991 [Favolaschia claudopus]|uniref:Uncharacterized protein n=1 Tax=Favolaschia claudopus TaxID=2862362 RepID=A0AAW0E5A3_9AGAR